MSNETPGVLPAEQNVEVNDFPPPDAGQIPPPMPSPPEEERAAEAEPVQRKNAR